MISAALFLYGSTRGSDDEAVGRPSLQLAVGSDICPLRIRRYGFDF